MKSKGVVALLATLIWLGDSPVHAGQLAQINAEQPQPDSYSIGKKRIDSGSVRIGLLIWSQYATQWNAKHGPFDPRIAFEFVEVATKNDMPEFFDSASELYLLGWGSMMRGFSAEFDMLYELEFNRSKPVMTDSVAREMELAWSAQHPEFGAMMSSFWLEKDLLIATARNERLIEHWMRIHEARKLYNRNKETVFATDIRGELYVKHGKPNFSNIRNVFVNGYTDPFTMSFVEFDGGLLFNLELEVWQYNNIGGEQVVYYMDMSAGGKKGYFTNVIELIPESGYAINPNLNALGTGGVDVRRVSRTYQNALITIAVLEQIAKIEMKSAGLYEQFMAELVAGSDKNNQMALPTTVTSLTRKFVNEEKQRVERRERILLSESSDKTGTMPVYPLEVKSFRMQESDRTTTWMLLYQTYVGLHLRVEERTMKGLGLGTGQFTFSNTFYQQDNNGKVLDRETEVSRANVNEDFSPVYTLVLNQKQIEGSLFLSQDALSMDRLNLLPENMPKTDQYNRMVFATTGKKAIELSEPLPEYGFTVSDIIIGDPDSFDIDQRFPIAPHYDLQFTPGQSVMVYFEVYRAPMDTYSAEVYFTQEKLIFMTEKMQDRAVVKLFNKTEQGFDKQFFVITLDDFKPGNYEMHIEFKSGEAGIEKQVPFRVRVK